MGSLHVPDSSSAVVTGRESICAILKLEASDKFPTVVESLRGNLDKAGICWLMLTSWLEFNVLQVPSYNRAQRCSCAAARDGIVCFGPKIVVRGL